MFRLVDRPLSFRHDASEWIYKMLFLWSRKPPPGPRAGPWLAWIATAVVLWRCRRRITKTILAVSPFRLLKRRLTLAALNSKASSTGSLLRQRQKQENATAQRKHKSVIARARVKQFYTGDGPHVTNSSSVVPSSPQIHYRVTRSGRIYGKYPNKLPTPANSSQGSQ